MNVAQDAISLLTGDIKEAPGCHIGPNTPAAYGSAYFPRREITFQIETLISCEIYMQHEVMKRCICAVAFPQPSADLQHKVKFTPWCQSFDRDGWSHCGCNKIKVLHVDISVTAQESHPAIS